MNKKQINWLLGEIETWRSEGLIASETAVQLDARYELMKKDHRPVGLIILGSLGALLIGLGIISLLAANWGAIPRDVRAVLSFLPLTISYSAALYCTLRMKRSLAVLEPVGIFWGLSIGAGIALISQTYHLPGEMSTFILSWMLLLAPVIWLTRSLGCVAGYYIGLLFWVGMVQNKLGTGICFWPLYGLILPVVIDVKRKSPSGMRGIFMFWLLLISSIIALGMTLERSLPGLWLIIYTSFFAVMLLWGSMVDREGSEMWSKPLSVCGAGGLAVVLYLLCYEWPWEDIGPSYYRYGYGYHLWASIVYDFSLTIALFMGALVLFLRWLKRSAGDPGCDTLTKITNSLWFASPLVITVLYGGASYFEGDADVLCSLLASVYMAVLSLLTIAEGIGRRALWMINCGMLLFLALVIGKFFTDDYSYTIKGIVFIVSGILFFVVNMIFARKLKRDSGQTQ